MTEMVLFGLGWLSGIGTWAFIGYTIAQREKQQPEDEKRAVVTSIVAEIIKREMV